MHNQRRARHRAGAHSSWFPAPSCPTRRDHRIPKPQPCPQEHPDGGRGCYARDLNKPQPRGQQRQDREKQTGLGCRLPCVRGVGGSSDPNLNSRALSDPLGGNYHSHRIPSVKVITETQPSVRGEDTESSPVDGKSIKEFVDILERTREGCL